MDAIKRTPYALPDAIDRIVRHVQANFRGAYIAGVLLALALAGCHSAAPPRSPSLAQRQMTTLQSLGFRQSDQGWMLFLPEPISFEFEKAVLKPAMRNRVDGIADELLRVEIRKLRVEGHTDNSGPRAFNLDLSQRRAEAVAQAFIARGFGDRDVARVGFGPDHPMSGNDTRDGRAENRRVEIIVPADATVLQP